MPDAPRSGSETLEDFFAQLEELEGIDSDVAQMLVQLYREGRLSNVNITNELSRIRGERLGNNSQAD